MAVKKAGINKKAFNIKLTGIGVVHKCGLLFMQWGRCLNAAEKI